MEDESPFPPIAPKTSCTSLIDGVFADEAHENELVVDEVIADKAFAFADESYDNEGVVDEAVPGDTFPAIGSYQSNSCCCIHSVVIIHLLIVRVKVGTIDSIPTRNSISVILDTDCPLNMRTKS